MGIAKFSSFLYLSSCEKGRKVKKEGERFRLSTLVD